jgi:hypothetical protein
MVSSILLYLVYETNSPHSSVQLPSDSALVRASIVKAFCGQVGQARLDEPIG